MPYGTATQSLVVINQFGESVTYTPSGQAARTVKAIIDYSSPDPQPVTHGGRATPTNRVSLWVSRDATSGIGTITPRADSVLIPFPKGGAARTMRVISVLFDTSPDVAQLLCEA